MIVLDALKVIGLAILGILALVFVAGLIAFRDAMRALNDDPEGF